MAVAKMNKQVKRKWLKALKSGEYKKGKHNLEWEGKYCCLGVLGAEMAPEEFCRELSYARKGYLPDDLAIMYGVDWRTQRDLGSINDESDTFAPVIDYIVLNL